MFGGTWLSGVIPRHYTIFLWATNTNYAVPNQKSWYNLKCWAYLSDSDDVMMLYLSDCDDVMMLYLSDCDDVMMLYLSDCDDAMMLYISDCDDVMMLYLSDCDDVMMLYLSDCDDVMMLYLSDCDDVMMLYLSDCDDVMMIYLGKLPLHTASKAIDCSLWLRHIFPCCYSDKTIANIWIDHHDFCWTVWCSSKLSIFQYNVYLYRNLVVYLAHMPGYI